MAAAKVVLVTGANSGLGYATVKALLTGGTPYHVLVGARTLDKAITAITALKKEVSSTTGTLEPIAVDLDSDNSIEAAFKQVQTKPGYLDILVNNGGASYDPEYLKGNLTLRESFTKAYNTNVAGTNVLTHIMMPLLLKSADPRLLFVTGLSHITKASENYFPTPPQPAGWPKDISFESIAYRCTKCALNMLQVDYAHKLKADGVKVWAVMPGLLATNLGGMGPEKIKEMGGQDPSVGANLVKSVIEGGSDADVGKMVSRDGILPW